MAPTSTARPDLGAIARDDLGLDATVAPLPGERDANGRLDCADGRRLVLKLHAAATEGPLLDLQDAALAALAAAALPTQRLVDRRVVSVGGEARTARILTWLDGRVLGDATPSPALLRDLGGVVARADGALAALDHPALDRPYRWSMLGAAGLLRAAPLVEPGLRPFVEATLAGFRDDLLPRLRTLPLQAIHNDANEHNVLVEGDRVVGLLDVGDVVRAPRVCGLAVAAAYAMLGAAEPARAILPLIAGYHAEAPLLPEEVDLVLDLARVRLAMSIANAAEQLRAEPANAAYLSISQARVREAVERLAVDPPALGRARVRDACGYLPVAAARELERYLQSAACDPAPLLRHDLRTAPLLVLDWSGEDADAAGGPSLGDRVAAAGAVAAIGRYREPRHVYRSAAYATPDPGGERRTVHMGVDVFVPAGEPVFAPLDGIVRAVEYRPDTNDYGGVVVLEHATDSGTPFWLLVGHLSRATAESLAPGRRVARGERIGEVGAPTENGGWPPHPHVQLFSDLLGGSTDLPGVVRASELDAWQAICPDPSLLLRLPCSAAAPHARDGEAILRRRRASLSATLSLSYREPLEIVAGDGAHLIDAAGGRWLDLVNNVCHVGHAHPRVVAALSAQAAVLNTNTRYLHPTIVEYARRLAATFPDPLATVFLVNSGSEANDLALRLARTATGREHVLALDWAYHGNLSSLVEISAYKFRRAGGSGPGARVRVCAVPDPYRGAHGGDGPAYARDVERHAHALAAAGTPPAAFIHESIPGCAGQVELAPGYLPAAYAAARAAGAIVIADEVQCGFGRVGDAMWAFEAHGVVPDIVTLGKPIGNGHPLGAVVARPEIARRFVTGMEYFNTFGGNPVSSSVGLAVLDVLRDERLMAHAATVGTVLQAGLTALAGRHALVGDVRGRGLFLGVELVRDRATLEPATVEARAVVEGAKRRGVLLSTDGPHDNVLKLKPPLVLTAADAAHAVAAIDGALAEAAAPG